MSASSDIFRYKKVIVLECTKIDGKTRSRETFLISRFLIWKFRDDVNEESQMNNRFIFNLKTYIFLKIGLFERLYHNLIANDKHQHSLNVVHCTRSTLYSKT